MTMKPPILLLSSAIFTLVFSRTFDSFPAGESQTGIVSALAGEGEMCSARIVIDASGVPCFQNAYGSSVEPQHQLLPPRTGLFFWKSGLVHPVIFKLHK